MEKELNIAAILKDKPVGLKFYSPTFGCISFNGVHKGKVYFFSDDTNAHSVKQNGKMYDGGECIIFPSNEMRDWSRFAWKKGDVLVSNDGGTEVIFDKWYDDTYTNFYSKHYLNSEDENNIKYNEVFLCTTERYSFEDKDTAQTYINTIEKRLGGKLNLETLEIEKQLEFKDGDIVFMREVKSEFSANCIFILRGEYNGEGNALYHAFYNADDKFVCAGYGSTRVHYNLRPATDEERQRLFDALAKENKKWDAEQKAIVDLPKKCEFKPFDKCVWKVQGFEGAIWQASFISYVDEYDAVPIGVSVYDLSNLIVLPYNEQTKHLLGTTDEWKGDEHD